MKKFLAIYLGTQEGFEKYKAMDEAMRKTNDQKGMRAWQEWFLSHQSSIIEAGSPLGKTKRITKAGVADVRNELGAWTVVEAPSLEEAAQMFINHPHFTIFPGEAVEVIECLPMPAQQ